MKKKSSSRSSVILILLAGVIYWGFHIFQDGIPSDILSDTGSKATASVTSETSENTTDNAGVPEVTGQKAVKGLELPADLQKRSSRTIVHTGYTLSWNPLTGLADWSAWVLTAARTTGHTDRDNYDFTPDPQLPASQAAVKQDYSRSGYDRGHLCPAGDNKWSARAMEECFYLSNICPQTPRLNRGDWKELEDLCRGWAREGYTLYIACGPLFTSANPKHIGKEHKLSVPDGFFKVILREKNGKRQALGFLYKNGNQDMPPASHAATVDEVERLSGFDFFSRLPDAEERRIEARKNTSEWNL